MENLIRCCTIWHFVCYGFPVLVWLKHENQYLRNHVYFRLLLCNREESRPLEAIARACVRPFAALFPTTGTITTKKLAKALISVSLKEPDPTKSVELLDNNAIHKSVTI